MICFSAHERREHSEEKIEEKQAKRVNLGIFKF